MVKGIGIATLWVLVERACKAVLKDCKVVMFTVLRMKSPTMRLLPLVGLEIRAEAEEPSPCFFQIP
jgi:hypothetical protein